MASTNGDGTGGTVAFTAYAATARCLARAVAGGFDACDDAGLPLSELQKVALFEAALREFDGFGVELTSLVAVGELLRDLGHG
jgi:hypothetical protein